MKATGIIRRIDDLGRIVIPKEIRRAKRIHENDPLEIFVDDEFILFRKYDIGETPKDILDDFVEAIEDHPYRKRIMGVAFLLAMALRGCCIPEPDQRERRVRRYVRQMDEMDKE